MQKAGVRDVITNTQAKPSCQTHILMPEEEQAGSWERKWIFLRVTIYHQNDKIHQRR
jgi:hypothetical protein